MYYSEEKLNELLKPYKRINTSKVYHQGKEVFSKYELYKKEFDPSTDTELIWSMMYHMIKYAINHHDKLIPHVQVDPEVTIYPIGGMKMAYAKIIFAEKEDDGSFYDD